MFNNQYPLSPPKSLAHSVQSRVLYFITYSVHSSVLYIDTNRVPSSVLYMGTQVQGLVAHNVKDVTKTDDVTTFLLMFEN